MKAPSAKAFDIAIIAALGVTTAQMGALTNDDIYKYFNPFVLCYWKVLLISFNGGLIALKSARMVFPEKPLDKNNNEPKP